MNTDLEEKFISLFSNLMTDGFNRSLVALENAEAVNLKKIKKQYSGIGSKYYDMVTEQMDETVKHAKPEIRKLVAEFDADIFRDVIDR
jgi:hypothetical protein